MRAGLVLVLVQRMYWKFWVAIEVLVRLWRGSEVRVCVYARVCVRACAMTNFDYYCNMRMRVCLLYPCVVLTRPR